MKPLFEEHQRYTQRWLWLVVIAVAVGNVATVVYAMWTQYVMKQPWGNEPMNDGKKLFLGTQKPDELLSAINKMKKGRTD